MQSGFRVRFLTEESVARCLDLGNRGLAGTLERACFERIVILNEHCDLEHLRGAVRYLLVEFNVAD